MVKKILAPWGRIRTFCLLKMNVYDHTRSLKKFRNLKNFFDEKLISKSWIMKIFFETFSRWEILGNFQLKSSFSRFFDFRKFSIEILVFSIFDFSKISTKFSSSHKKCSNFFSAESIFKILVPGKNCELPLQNTFTLHLANT